MYLVSMSTCVSATPQTADSLSPSTITGPRPSPSVSALSTPTDVLARLEPPSGSRYLSVSLDYSSTTPQQYLASISKSIASALKLPERFNKTSPAVRNMTGIIPSSFHFYQLIPQPPPSQSTLWPPFNLLDDANVNSDVYLTLLPRFADPPSNSSKSSPFADILDSDIWNIVYECASLNAWGRRVFLRPAPDMNIPSIPIHLSNQSAPLKANPRWALYGAQPNAFKAFFRKLSDALRSLGDVTMNTTLVWAPRIGVGYPWVAPNPSTTNSSLLNSFRPTNADVLRELDTNADDVVDGLDDPYEAYYPGDEYVDWVAVSVFPVYGSSWRDVDELSFLEALWGFYEEYAVRRNKPMMISEFGVGYAKSSARDGERVEEVKRRWWRLLITSPSFLSRFRNIKMVCLSEMPALDLKEYISAIFASKSKATLAYRFLHVPVPSGLVNFWMNTHPTSNGTLFRDLLVDFGSSTPISTSLKLAQSFWTRFFAHSSARYAYILGAKTTALNDTSTASKTVTPKQSNHVCQNTKRRRFNWPPTGVFDYNILRRVQDGLSPDEAVADNAEYPTNFMGVPPTSTFGSGSPKPSDDPISNTNNTDDRDYKNNTKSKTSTQNMAYYFMLGAFCGVPTFLVLGVVLVSIMKRKRAKRRQVGAWRVEDEESHAEIAREREDGQGVVGEGEDGNSDESSIGDESGEEFETGSPLLFWSSATERDIDIPPPPLAAARPRRLSKQQPLQRNSSSNSLSRWPYAITPDDIDIDADVDHRLDSIAERPTDVQERGENGHYRRPYTALIPASTDQA
ncbi:hypothetical protein HDV05_000239 [Chytridiales sp. JEL 0842]|nr:hypothetical protein HDV05_000239 [Chytridiales sp. JEL 0842]